MGRTGILGLFCARFNEKRIQENKPTIDLAIVNSGARDIVKTFYLEKTTGDSTHPLRPLVRNVIEDELLTSNNLRDRRPLSALTECGVTEGELALLVDRRVLRKEWMLDQDYYEFIHDVLAKVAAKNREERWQREARVQRRKTRAIIVLVGLGVVALTALLVWFSYRRRQALDEEEQRKIAETSEKQEHFASQQKLASTFSDQASRAILNDRFDDAIAAIISAHEAAQRAQKELDSLKGRAAFETPPALPFLSARALATVQNGSLLVEDKNGITHLAVSEDGTHAATTSSHGASVYLMNQLGEVTRSVHLMDTFGTSSLGREKSPPTDLVEEVNWFMGAPQVLTFSADGKKLFGIGDGGVVVVLDTDTHRPVKRFRTAITEPTLRVDRTGSYAVLSDLAETLIFVDLTGPKIKAVALASPSPDAVDKTGVGTRPADPNKTSIDGVHIAPDASFVLAQRELETDEKTLFELWKDPATGASSPTSLRSQPTAKVGTVVLLDHPATGQYPSTAAWITRTPTGETALWAATDKAVEKVKDLPIQLGRSGGMKPFGNTLVTAVDGTVQIYTVDWTDPGSAPLIQQQTPLRNPGTLSVELNPGKNTAALRTETDALWFDLTSRRPVFTLGSPQRKWFYGFDDDREFVVLPGAQGALSLSDNRVRYMPATAAVVHDRFFWGPTETVSSEASVSLNRYGYALTFRFDGSQLVIFDRMTDKVWFGSRLTSKTTVADIQFEEWPSQSSDLVEVVTRANRTVVVERNGTIRFFDGFKFSGKGALGTNPSRALVRLSADGKWAAVSLGLDFVQLWNTTKAKVAWQADLRRERRGSERSLPAASVTALEVTVDNLGTPLVAVGDSAGGVRVIESRLAPVYWSLVGKRKESHKDRVSLLDIAPSRVVLSGGQDGTTVVTRFDKAQNEMISGPTHGGSVTAVRFVEVPSSDPHKPITQRALTAGEDYTVWVWDPSTGDPVCPAMRLHSSPVVAIDTTGRDGEVLTRDRSGTVIFWDFLNCEPTGPRFQDVLIAGVVTDQKDQFLSVSRQKELSIRDRIALHSAPSSTPQGSWTWGVQVGSKQLVAADETGRVFEFDPTAPGKEPKEVLGPTKGGGIVAQNGGRSVVVFPGGDLLFWEREPDKAVLPVQKTTWPAEPGWALQAAQLSTDGKVLFVVESKTNGELRGRRLSDGATQSVDVEQFDQVEIYTRSDGCGRWAGPTDDSQEAAFAITAEERSFGVWMVDSAGCVRFWLGAPEPVVEAVGPNLKRVGDAPTALRVLPEKNKFVLGTLKGSMSVWEVGLNDRDAPNVRILTLDRQRHDRRIRSITLHPQGRWAASAGEDGDVWLWDLQENQALIKVGSLPSAVKWTTFDSAGTKLLVGGADGWMRAFDISTSKSPGEIIDELKPWVTSAAAR
ncbi:MAG: hypothetical protein IPK82_25310 [Polyangiaceae bacterium]|nr:hypothetical protein [Polyangiaceae bacterium]